MSENDWQGRKQEKLRLYWKVREERKRKVRERYERLQPHLGERGTRLWAANEALSFGPGGVRAVAEALAISAKTIVQGQRELQAPPSHPSGDVVGGRQRRPGGGRNPSSRNIGIAGRDRADRRPGHARGSDEAAAVGFEKLAPRGERTGSTRLPNQHPTVSKILQEELDYSLQGIISINRGTGTIRPGET